MLRLDDLAVRSAELNRAVAAIDRSAWMATGPNHTGRTGGRGTPLRTLIARVTRHGSAAATSARSTLRPA